MQQDQEDQKLQSLYDRQSNLLVKTHSIFSFRWQNHATWENHTVTYLKPFYFPFYNTTVCPILQRMLDGDWEYSAFLSRSADRSWSDRWRQCVMETAPVRATLTSLEIWDNLLNLDIMNGNINLAVKWGLISSIWRLSCTIRTGRDSVDTRSERNLSLMPKSAKKRRYWFSQKVNYSSSGSYC